MTRDTYLKKAQAQGLTKMAAAFNVQLLRRKDNMIFALVALEVSWEMNSEPLIVPTYKELADL